MSAVADPLSWDVARRWRQYDAEVRVNLVRIAALGAFYAVHLIHHLSGKYRWLAFLGLDGGNRVSERTHIAITCLTIAWVMAAIVIHRLLQDRIFPRWLMYASALGDLLLLTAILVLTSGPVSPLVHAYFLVVMMSGLRLELRLVWFTTATALAGYLFVLGCARWPIGLAKLQPLPHIPRYQQIMVGSALILAGIVVGQWLRHTRQLAHDLLVAGQETRVE